jgi:hypothetical protein
MPLASQQIYSKALSHARPHSIGKSRKTRATLIHGGNKNRQNLLSGFRICPVLLDKKMIKMLYLCFVQIDEKVNRGSEINDHFFMFRRAHGNITRVQWSAANFVWDKAVNVLATTLTRHSVEHLDPSDMYRWTIGSYSDVCKRLSDIFSYDTQQAPLHQSIYVKMVLLRWPIITNWRPIHISVLFRLPGVSV